MVDGSSKPYRLPPRTNGVCWVSFAKVPIRVSRLTCLAWFLCLTTKHNSRLMNLLHLIVKTSLCRRESRRKKSDSLSPQQRKLIGNRRSGIPNRQRHRARDQRDNRVRVEVHKDLDHV